MKFSNRSRLLLAGALLCLLTPGSLAVSPSDIALAQKMIHQAAKLAEKYRKYDLVAPAPLPDSSGKYVSPYLADGDVTAWAEKALEAEAGAQAGDMAGDAAADTVARKIPFGGLLRGKTKDTASAAGAVAAIGGWDFIRESSDLSYEEMDDIAVYLHVTHGEDPSYDQTLAAAMNVYPELKKGYSKALKSAYKKAKKESR